VAVAIVLAGLAVLVSDASRSGIGVLRAAEGSPVELARYERATGRLTPFLGGIAAEGVDFSRDGRRVAFTTFPEGELWTCGPSGGDARRLTEAPFRAALPHLSPDKRVVAFAERTPRRPWQIHLVASLNKPAKTLPPENAIDPKWTPDGATLVFGGLFGSSDGIFEQDLHTSDHQRVANSEKLFSPRPSPNGRFLAALHSENINLVVLDRRTGLVPTLATAVAYPPGPETALASPTAAGSGSSDRPARPPRGELATRRRGLAGGDFGAWSGFTPDGAPLVLVDLRRLRPRAARRGLRRGGRNTTR
jgi:dipeptidyl aminopeptidase/acylaminoacyl peptidase